MTSPITKLSDNFQLNICHETVLPATSCRGLNVMFNDDMHIDAQISHIYRATHFHLHNIDAIRKITNSINTVKVNFFLPDPAVY